jgi:hypothetical protein
MKIGVAAPFFGQIPCIFANSEPYLVSSLGHEHSDDVALWFGALDVASPDVLPSSQFGEPAFVGFQS